MKEYSGVHWKPLGTIDTSGHRLLSKTETGLPGTKWETRFFFTKSQMIMMPLSVPVVTTLAPVAFAVE